MFQCKKTENLESFIITQYGAASKLCVWFIKQSVMFRCKQTENLRGQITLEKGTLWLGRGEERGQVGFLKLLHVWHGDLKQ